ncbi:MAG: ribonucleotide-diphosphate reductase subunit alpha, partial [Aerococcus urinaeequi]|nr:ribonucleotide-diphosphate reductase subunit alpha [Aerococcus urinaeequi]
MTDTKKLKIENTKDITYFKLNNMVNIPTANKKIQLNKDREAVRAYFLEYVNPNTVFFHTLEEKLQYLVDNDYIEEGFLNKYSFDFIQSLFDHLYSHKFRFKSFMGAYKFYTQYALKTNDNKRFLERYEDRIAFTALYLADGDEDLAWYIAEEHIEHRLQMATPTFLNAGKKRRGEMVSCFLIDVQDNMESIGRAVNSSLQLSKRGGGVGVNLSNLREAGAAIKDIENAGSGVVPVMKLLEDAFSYANQLGQRNGAGVVYLNAFHPDVYEFLSTKKENADEKIRVKTLSLGLVVPDKYYELLKTNEPMYLFSPYDVERIYGKPFGYVNITEHYEDMVANKDIKKYKINARELEQEISRLQQESGYPYIMNVDTANKENPVNGTITMSNLCSEIMQVQKPSTLNEDLTYEEVGLDISCNLASTNITEMLKTHNFEQAVDTAVRALTAVSDMTSIQAV